CCIRLRLGVQFQHGLLCSSTHQEIQVEVPIFVLEELHQLISDAVQLEPVSDVSGEFDVQVVVQRPVESLRSVDKELCGACVNFQSLHIEAPVLDRERIRPVLKVHLLHRLKIGELRYLLHQGEPQQSPFQDVHVAVSEEGLSIQPERIVQI